MRIRPTPLLIVMFCALVVARPAAAVDSAAVEASIKKAKTYLYAQMKNGTWETADSSKYANNNQHDEGQWGGLTALCTYALLAAGESPQEAKLAKAIAFLKGADIRGTYALGLRMQVWLLLPESKETKEMMKRDAQMLLNGTQMQGAALGMHDYTPTGTSYSHSRAQYAVLGLWAAEQTGVEVPAKYWEVSEAAWLDHQDRSGGWAYQKGGAIPVTPGMTAPGVATLFITQDYLHAHEAVDCRGLKANPAAQAIDRGVEWLSKNFDLIATDKPFARSFPYVTLYAVERVGVAGGLKFFGTHDWFEKGANFLLKKQNANGSWGAGKDGALFTPAVDTAFSLLFLVRGRAPVAIAKLDYTSDPKKPVAWNQRPRDIANAVRFIGRSLERDLNWQVVNLQVEATELLDAPVLYMSGSQAIVLTDPQIDKLRAYVEMGGLIFGHADCNSVAFAASFRKLGEKLFPSYEFRELPAGHVLYNMNYKYANWKQKPAIQGLTNGSRELMLLAHAGDPARLWQIRAVKGREEPWQLITNLFMYTSDRKDLRFKGDTHWITADAKIKPTRKLSVARLELGGNWNPEPGGWRRMEAVMHNRHQMNLEIQTVKPGEGKLTPGAFKVAHLTGTTKLNPSEAAIDELKKYIAGGGMLVIDAAGGSGDFADSAEALAKSLLPEGASLGQFGSEHAVYQGAGGKAIEVDWRPFAARSLRGGLRLMGAEIGGKLAVILSREDLSTALVGQQVDGVFGYSPATATELMARLLNLAGGNAPAKADAPAKPEAAAKPDAPAKPAKPAKKK